MLSYRRRFLLRLVRDELSFSGKQLLGEDLLFDISLFSAYAGYTGGGWYVPKNLGWCGPVTQ